MLYLDSKDSIWFEALVSVSVRSPIGRGIAGITFVSSTSPYLTRVGKIFFAKNSMKYKKHSIPVNRSNVSLCALELRCASSMITELYVFRAYFQYVQKNTFTDQVDTNKQQTFERLWKR